MIDWDRVTELRDEVGAEDFTEVLELFFEEVDEVMDRLRAGPEPDTYEAELHFLKGSALNLGFRALSSLCSQGERAARGAGRCRIDLAQVIRVYEMSRISFEKNRPRITATP